MDDVEANNTGTWFVYSVRFEIDVLDSDKSEDDFANWNENQRVDCWAMITTEQIWSLFSLVSQGMF